MGKRWYAVRTKPNKESYAKENLLRQGFEVYLPVVKRLVSHAGKKAFLPRPFFAGYLFVGLRPEERNWTAINSTYGVLCAVHFGGVYPPVPEDLICELKAREDASGYVSLDLLKRVPFRQGDKVVLKTGEGMLEAIFQAMSSEDRAVVLVELLKREIKVEVPVESLNEY